MITHSVLASVFIPVKEDDISGLWDIAIVSPLTSLNKPICTDTTTGKLWDDTSIDVPTLVGTPGNKGCTPCGICNANIVNIGIIPSGNFSLW